MRHVMMLCLIQTMQVLLMHTAIEEQEVSRY